MKKRKSYYVTLPDGSRWWGDCPTWAAELRQLGHTVVVGRIVGPRKPCDYIGCRGH